MNTLTVVATESYEQFAESLQKEIEQETGIRFGIVEKHQFAAIPIVDASGRTIAVGLPMSEAIWNHLRDTGMVDAKGKVQDRLRQALKDDTFTLPEDLAAPFRRSKTYSRSFPAGSRSKTPTSECTSRPARQSCKATSSRHCGTGSSTRQRTACSSTTKPSSRSCIKAINEAPPVTKTRLKWRKADIVIGKSGVEATETSTSPPITIEEDDIELPDILTDLEEKTQLTRRSLARILTECARLDDFQKNPQVIR